MCIYIVLVFYLKIRLWLVKSLVIVQHIHCQNLINNNTSTLVYAEKENGYSFPKLYLKIMRKTLHFQISHVSELNFHNCKIIDNY